MKWVLYLQAVESKLYAECILQTEQQAVRISQPVISIPACTHPFWHVCDWTINSLTWILCVLQLLHIAYSHVKKSRQWHHKPSHKKRYQISQLHHFSCCVPFFLFRECLKLLPHHTKPDQKLVCGSFVIRLATLLIPSSTFTFTTSSSFHMPMCQGRNNYSIIVTVHFWGTLHVFC
jgi:hypothetical protein